MTDKQVTLICAVIAGCFHFHEYAKQRTLLEVIHDYFGHFKDWTKE